MYGSNETNKRFVEFDLFDMMGKITWISAEHITLHTLYVNAGSEREAPGSVKFNLTKAYVYEIIKSNTV